MDRIRARGLRLLGCGDARPPDRIQSGPHGSTDEHPALVSHSFEFRARPLPSTGLCLSASYCYHTRSHRKSFPMRRTLPMRVLDTVELHSMIRSGDRIGVGVSGGADSVALLRLLAELRAQLGIQLFVLHFHHQLRGADADEDEFFVAQLAREFGFDLVADRADVAQEARRN